MTNINHGSYCRCAACIDAENRVTSQPTGATSALNYDVLYGLFRSSGHVTRDQADEFANAVLSLVQDQPKPPEAASARTNDILEAARKSGLRSHLHGVNATEARKLLSDFLAVLSAPTPAGAQPAVATGIYVASRASVPERPMMWQGLRLKGWPITSTWIDEAGEGETESNIELWQRIHNEIAASAGVLLYAEVDDFPLKGALVECGIALGMGKPVAFVLPDVALAARSMKPIGSWAAHPNVRRFDDLAAAKDWLLASSQALAAPAAAQEAALAKISDLLTSMFSVARAHVRGEDEEVFGYTVRCGALHKIVGILSSYKPVIIPATMPKAHETITGLLCGTSAASPAPEAEPAPFQARVKPWLLECFGEAIAGDREERNHRFLEEALELVQACGCTAGEAHQLVDYTFGRPVGEKAQEVGGVMVTLAALCLAQDLDMHAEGETELARIGAPDLLARIRAKQAAKPKYSPLPVAPAVIGASDASNLVPGQMHCARCKFQLTRTILYMGNGAVGAGDSKTEPCPNGCGPLWPVTWEQAARNAWATGETMFERAKKAEDALQAIRGPRLVATPAPTTQSAAPLTDLQCTEIYWALDAFGREVDSLEYGLPSLIEENREVVAFAVIRDAARRTAMAADPEPDDTSLETGEADAR